MASQQIRIAHHCRFPGCSQVFSHRQGMSRHMAKVHGVAAGSYKAVTTAVALNTTSAPARATAPSASLSRPDTMEVERLMDAFRGCGGPTASAESLLSEATLQEVLKSAAVALPVLSPLQELDVSSDEDDVDVVADYATDDDVDDTPTPHELLKVRRVHV